ncbi:DUF3598 family protein [Microcoleus sp. Pol14C6]|uniref:DUF3598 family protein n=1 Tax=unclassified Microcoleus TaxID=2642155 RepID=UPI002FCF521B
MNNDLGIHEDTVNPLNSPDLEKVPEIFIRQIGTWKGEFIKTDTRGHFFRSFLCTISIAIEGSHHRHVNNYEYSDGSRLQLNFQGEYENRILKLFSNSYPDFSGVAWDAGQDIMCFRSTKTEGNALITFVETITLVSDNHRVRSTQIFKDGIFDGTAFIEERRI